MIQLKVYPNTNKVRSQQIFLDLYDSEPIKLNLSIEDITDADATSVFSRTFKIPATRHNNEFFKNAFEVDGVDYDVTVKKPAEILVDGAEFRQGHIRLQKIYINDALDKTDYELLFLGETRDFSTVIGDKPMCVLNMPDLQISDGAGGYRNPTKDDIEASWNAYPQTATVDSNGNPNGGINNGNILFPLVDHGNTYDDQGVVQQVEIRIANNSSGERSFTDPGEPLSPSQMKPMIRAKRIWDQIFEDAGYTYTSNFINSPLFHQMYVSAFGNEATPNYSTTGSGANLLNAEYNDNNQPQYFNDPLYLPDNIFDPGNNYQMGGLSIGSRYIAPATAVGGDAAKYRIVAEAYVFAEREVSCPQACFEPVVARLRLKNLTTGQVYKTSGWGYSQTVGFTLDTEIDNITINAGDILVLDVEPYDGTYFEEVYNIKWQIQAAPGTLLPSADLDCEYKQIDFIKDVLKMFRLVLAPDRNDTKNFIVEPWQTYINSGDLHDWSHKLVKNKDVVLEPLFNTQSEEIDFRFQMDEDWVNHYHQEQFKEVYGYLQFDSQNELLKGAREIKTLEIAPTPLATIQEDGTNQNHQAPGWIIPQVHVHDSEDTGVQHLPIKPKTRFLFYNGRQPIPNGLSWYLGSVGATNEYTDYPLVSPYQNWPQTQDGLNLNWYNDIKYWQQVPSTQIFNTDGQTLYTQYWSRYIESLYNKFSRRMTAYFVLNNVDLQTLSFDDTIFVNGKYWRPEKIIDVNIGERTEVQCQLISANDYKPPVYVDEPLTNFSAQTVDETCGCDGIITVNTDGASPFTWQLDNGQTGTATTTGPNPQVFDIEGICAGEHVLTVYDDLGRYNTAVVTVNPSPYSEVTSTNSVTPDPNCYSSSGCAGSVTVTPSGGSGAPYTITWVDGPTSTTSSSVTRNGLCGGYNYSYRVTDSAGCESDVFTVTVECADPVTNHVLRQDLDCAALSSITYIAAAPVSYAIGTYVDLVELGGCFQVMNYTSDPAQYTIGNTYANCTACQGTTPPQLFKIETCPSRTTPVPEETKYLLAYDYPALTLGSSVKIAGSNYCWTVTQIVFDNQPQETVTETFIDCADCQAVQPNKYVVESCTGFTPEIPEPTGGTEQTELGNATDLAIAPLATTFRMTYTFDQCLANGLAATFKVDDTRLPAGWYYFNPNINFTNYVTLPADTKISIVRIDGSTGTYGDIIEVLDTILLSDYGSLTAGASNSFTYTTSTSFYIETGTQQRFGLVIYRDNGQPCVQGGGAGSLYAIDMSLTQNCDLNPYWLGDSPSGYTITANGSLGIGNIIKVNDLISGDNLGCFEVVGTAQPDAVVSGEYNSDAGVFESCETCTGNIPQQNCHTVTAGSGGAEISWYYDDGGECATCVGLAAYSQGMSAGQTITICAQVNSIQIIVGTATIVDSGTECYRYVDPVTGTVGTSCDTPTPPTSYCYTLTATSTAGGEFTYTQFNWFLDNVLYSRKLRIGTSITICADQNTPQAVSGSGTITGGIDLCDRDGDCNPTCYQYLYEGPGRTDLLFIDCDGNRGYYADVWLVTGGLGVLPDCISEIVGGTAVPFLSQYAACI